MSQVGVATEYHVNDYVFVFVAKILAVLNHRTDINLINGPSCEPERVDEFYRFEYAWESHRSLEYLHKFFSTMGLSKRFELSVENISDTDEHTSVENSI